MKREDLDKYFPRYGDQIAALGFARRMDGNNDGNNDGATSFVSGKLSLMERLKSKAPSKDKRFEKGISNKNASRPERKIEIGWVDFNFEHSEFQQVRKPVGGTRRLTVAKDVTMSELLEIAKQIFFVDGKSAKGYLFEFEASLSDFSGNCYAPELTVADLSEKLFLTDLRVYLSTKCLLKENKRKRKKCSKKSSAASVASVKNDDSDDDFLPELNLRSSPVVTTSLTVSNIYSNYK